MIIKINDREYNIPVTLFDISIGQRAEYETLHGLELTKEFKRISELEDEVERKVDLNMWFYKMLAVTVSYFCGIPMDVVEQTSYGDLLAIYQGCLEKFVEDVDFKNYQLQTTQQQFEWQGEIWELTAPEIITKSKMQFGEFIDAKQSAENLFEEDERKWQSLLVLCAIFFRKKGEKYDPDFTDEDNERYKLIKTLPLTYAVQVGFFLNRYRIIYQNIFHSFGQLEQKQGAMFVSI